MFLKMFTVYDKKAAAYLQPFFMRAEGEAVRAMTQTASNPDSQFAKTPEDYQLCVCAEFDDLTGVVTPLPLKVLAEVSGLVSSTPIEDHIAKLSTRDRFEQECA